MNSSITTDRFPPVLSKKDFVLRYQKGEFGNCSPTWDNPSQVRADGYPGLLHIRNRVAGGPTWYNVWSDQLDDMWRLSLATEGVLGESQLYISAMAPTEKTILQGEVMRSEGGLYLYYSTVVAPMRDALRTEAKEARMVTALGLLSSALCPNSYDWLMILLDRYPDHVVEFSAYSTKWGTLFPKFNTCFWEVRLY